MSNRVPRALVHGLGLALGAVAMGYLAATLEEGLLGFALGLFWSLAIAAVLSHRSTMHFGGEPWWRVVVIAGLLIRVPIVFVHIVIGYLVYGGQQDFAAYHYWGVDLVVKLLRGNFEFFEIPYLDPSQGGAAVVTRFLAVATFVFGPGLTGLFIMSGIVGFMGSYLFVRAFQAAFPGTPEIRRVALMMFFFPSLAFWTSLLGKDSWTMLFLGMSTYAGARMLATPRPRYLLGFFASLALVATIRPPVGLAIVVAASAVLLMTVRRHMVSGPAAVLRPVVWAACAMVIVVAVAVVAEPIRKYEQAFSADTPLTEGMLNLAVHKGAGLSTDPNASGSSIHHNIQPGVVGYLKFLPQGMFAFMFRPLVFEAHNILALAASLEGTTLLVITLWRLPSLLRALRLTLRDPFVTYCVMVLLTVTAGLAPESNFGVVVRHRAMVLPFFFMLMTIPRERMRAVERVPASARVGPTAAMPVRTRP